MSNLVRSAAYAASQALSAQGLTVKRSHLSEIIAALLGYRTHAALAVEEADPKLDYHLDDGDTGIALQARLAARFGARPTLIVSADDTGAVRGDALATGLSLLPKPVRPLALKSVLDRMRAMRG